MKKPTYIASTFYFLPTHNAKAEKNKKNPSIEVSYERLIGRKFSINGTFNYAKRSYHYGENTDFTWDDNSKDWSIIPEGRYYLPQNSSGLFFQLGIPFTYSKWIEVNTFHNPIGPSSFYNHNYDMYRLSVNGGFGIKYPLSPKIGIEMCFSYSPDFNFIDYYTFSWPSGGFKSGVKILF